MRGSRRDISIGAHSSRLATRSAFVPIAHLSEYITSNGTISIREARNRDECATRKGVSHVSQLGFDRRIGVSGGFAILEIRCSAASDVLFPFDQQHLAIRP